ncbi:MAG: winged helix-turn-helix transcriptional regulator, partial [Candidatus Eisenbacteria bacterium]
MAGELVAAQAVETGWQLCLLDRLDGGHGPDSGRGGTAVDTSKAKRLRSIPAYVMHAYAMDRRAARSRNILACLGDSSRFRIALLLLEGERCVTELALAVGLSQSCTTRHLQYLEREGLVRGARQGKRVVFRLRSDRARVRELLAW